MSINVWSLDVWLHVLAGTVWLGLLYYFNFVQAPAIQDAAENRNRAGPAAIEKYLLPRALLWFRWSAVVTWITGIIALEVMGVGLLNAFTLQAGAKTIGVGAWLGTLMLFNVWVLIWPAQKKILGLVDATEEQIEHARSTVLLTSRTNVVFSIPMLMCMVGHGHGLPI